jgi:hypothetical protein
VEIQHLFRAVDGRPRILLCARYKYCSVNFSKKNIQILLRGETGAKQRKNRTREERKGGAREARPQGVILGASSPFIFSASSTVRVPEVREGNFFQYLGIVSSKIPESSTASNPSLLSKFAPV